MKNILIILIVLTTLFLSYKNIDKQRLQKITTNDDYNFISINNILMWIANNGDGSHDPNTDGNGFYWPGGKDATQSAIFEDGFLFGGIVDGDVRVGGSTYRSGLQAGKILENGEADDPSLEKYRVYKIRKDWRDLQPGENLTQEEIDQYQRDYDEWPVEDGAPWIDLDGDGIFTHGIDEPQHVGDETLWFVANDFDPSRTTFLYGKLPLGIEMQTTVYAFNKPGLEDVVFKKYLLINKGNNQIDSMYTAIWSDPDLGDANDDFVGGDVNLDLAYCWNGDNDDYVYGSPPPAVGYALLQGPVIPSINDSAFFNDRFQQGFKNLQLSSFSLFIGASAVFSDPSMGVAQGSTEMYNYFIGRLWSGQPFINPLTADVTRFTLSGDPVSGQGWYEGIGWPGGPVSGDRRMVASYGPFNMTPGDSQETVFAIVIAKGNDNVDSIQELRKLSQRTKTLYNNRFEIPKVPFTNLYAVATDTPITLYWSDELTNFSKLGYSFEGFKIYQYKNTLGEDAHLQQLFDIENGLTSIWDYQEVNGSNVLIPVLDLPDQGLKYKAVISEDAFSKEKLLLGSEYYFGITAFAYSSNNVPRLIESEPTIISIIPGSKLLDETIDLSTEDFIMAEQKAGWGHGRVGLKIVDPTVLNNTAYSVVFDNVIGKDHYGNLTNTLFYHLIDQIKGDTLISQSLRSEYWWEAKRTDSLKIIDGFQLIVQNTGQDSLEAGQKGNAIKSVLEINGPDGINLEYPVNVLDGRLNSTGTWSISAEDWRYNYSSKVDMNWQNDVGRARYEIRFTSEEEGSEYYLTGYEGGFISSAPFKNSFKAGDKVPFAIWTLGEDLDSENDDQRLIIKILDNNNFDSTMAIPDARWSQFPEDDSLRAGQWERIFAYYPVDSIYPEVLPEWSGLSNHPRDLHKIGQIIITGEVPEPGTVVQIDTWRPLSPADTFVVTATAPIRNDYTAAKKRLDDISVFPNPYFGADPFGRFPDRNYVRFTNLPAKVTVRIFTLSGQLVSKIEKDSASPWLDWNLRNINGKAVASGIYIAHLEMPRIGKKVIKLALVQDN